MEDPINDYKTISANLKDVPDDVLLNGFKSKDYEKRFNCSLNVTGRHNFSHIKSMRLRKKKPFAPANMIPATPYTSNTILHTFPINGHSDDAKQILRAELPGAIEAILRKMNVTKPPALKVVEVFDEEPAFEIRVK